MSTDSSSDRDPVERLAEEFLDRLRRGERATPDEYAKRHPEWAERILEAFPALELMERLKPGNGELTGSYSGVGDGDATTTPERLGDYRILREVGRGGMGVVYEAIQESLGRHVALKVLPDRGRGDAIPMERFRLEARSAASLHHTHIVPVHGLGQHEGMLYYAMQFIQGCGLDAVIDDLRQLRAGAPVAPATSNRTTAVKATRSRAAAEGLISGRFAGTSTVGPTLKRSGDVERPPAYGDGSGLSGGREPGYHRSVARIGVQVAEALAHAHSQGILHRDIKPSNLLLDADGAIWVTDFGLAKVEGGDDLTQIGDVVGTLRYMAPERFDGWSDPRSDVYGLGITLYELLTLRPAYESRTRAQLIEQVLNDAPIPPRKIDATIPRDLETVVLKAIAKEPTERYTTAQAMADDLTNFLVGKPIRARRVSVPERIWRWCRRNPTAAGLVGASVVAAMALVGGIVGWIDNSRVRAALEEGRHLRYSDRIALADREWQNNNGIRAMQLLDKCDKDLHGWEWGYLNKLFHTEFKESPPHPDVVFGVAYSPDGKRIASASWDGSVQLRDATTLEVIGKPSEFGGPVCSVAFSWDGKRLATGVGELHGKQAGKLVIWTPETNEKALVVIGHVGAILSVAFSPNGKLLASAGEDRTIQIINAATGELVKILRDETNGFTSVAFSPDGKFLATATGTREEMATENVPGKALIYDATDWSHVRKLKGHSGSVNCVAYSPDGRRLATASSDRTVIVWDTETGAPVHTLQGHTMFAVGVAFSPDGKKLVSASEDQSLKVWDAETGDLIETLWGHVNMVNCVAYSPDNEHLVSGGDDKTIKVWNAERTPLAKVLGGAGRKWFTHVAFDPDGKTLAAANVDRTVTVWDLQTFEPTEAPPASPDPIWGLAFGKGGRIAAASGESLRKDRQGMVIIWDRVTGKALTLHSGQSVIWSAAFSPDGHIVATAGGEMTKGPGELKLWDAETGEMLFEFEGQKRGVTCVTFSSDGKRLAAATADEVRVWEIETHSEARTLRRELTENAPYSKVISVAFSPDGRRIAASGIGSVTIWELATGKSTILRGHNGEVRQAVFHPKEERLATAGYDGTVKIWDLNTGQEVLTLHGHKGPVMDVAFSPPDGRQLVSAGRDGTIRIWDATPGVAPGAAASRRGQGDAIRDVGRTTRR